MFFGDPEPPPLFAKRLIVFPAQPQVIDEERDVYCGFVEVGVAQSYRW
jgi:hypothetical protein